MASYQPKRAVPALSASKKKSTVSAPRSGGGKRTAGSREVPRRETSRPASAGRADTKRRTSGSRTAGRKSMRKRKRRTNPLAVVMLIAVIALLLLLFAIAGEIMLFQLKSTASPEETSAGEAESENAPAEDLDITVTTETFSDTAEEYSDGTEEEPAEPEEAEQSDAPEEAEEPEESAEEAVPFEQDITVSFTGDFMGHIALTYDTIRSEVSDADFSPLFQYAGTALTDTDYLVGNLETTLSGTVDGYPTFSSPDGLADSLADLGFDLMTTANNHCMDKGFDGLCRTLDLLDEAGIAHIGTYRTEEERDENSGVYVADVDGVSIAFLDYTYGCNYGFAEHRWSVNCYNIANRAQGHTDLDTDRITEEMEYARSLDTDLIIVLVHWGVEYHTQNSEDQSMLADLLIEQGADAVIGGHSHVPQPFEYRTVTDFEGEERTGFVCYSLGNFISNQHDENTNLTAVLNLRIVKTEEDTEISNVDYVPMYVLIRAGTPAHLLLDTRAALAAYDSGEMRDVLNYSDYRSLKQSLDTLASIFGEEWDLTPFTAEKTAEEEVPETEITESTGESSGTETTIG